MSRSRARTFAHLALAPLASLALVGCSSGGSSNASSSADASVDLGGDAGPAAWGDDGVAPPHKDPPDGGAYVYEDGGVVLRPDRFAASVVSFAPGDCAGYGIPSMPAVVLGPPLGEGTDLGSLDVLSLGNGGSLVLSFGSNAIVDGPGPDFIVFENPFFVGGDPSHVAAEPGEVSVSDDGSTWKTFPCTATSAPYGACAGWHPVYSNPSNGISPVDPTRAGGEAYDLADVGLTHARFVRVVDKAGETCPPNPNKVNTNGFDLDAVAIVNAETP